MKNEEKNRKQQLTSLPISINILKAAMMVAGVYYFGVKFLLAIFLWWAVRQLLRLFFITLKILFWGVIALFSNRRPRLPKMQTRACALFQQDSQVQ